MSSFHLSRRHLLATASSLAGCSLLPRAGLAASPRNLAITRRSLEVNGRAATMFGIQQPDGTHGLVLDPDEAFRVDLVNRCGEAAIVHWHGQTPPFLQDGVAGFGRSLIEPDGSVFYDFAPRPGTHWMHSHHGLQEQHLMAAPLIVRRAADVAADVQEVVVLLHDFTFRDPVEILAELGGMAMDHGGHGMPEGEMAGMDHGTMNQGAMNHDTGGMDLNDVEYDAYLANDRTLADPLVVRVERRGRVRVRLINGATTTAFHIDLGALTGTVVAVDGNDIEPVTGSRFGMSMGQRLDILIDLPEGGGAFPILAEREGAMERTGIILATPDAAVEKLSETAHRTADPIDLAWEAQFRAISGLSPRAADLRLEVALTGSMSPYVWSINDSIFGQHEPLKASLGQRVEIEFVNRTGMAHPMHLHGHHFQVIGIGDTTFAGAMRDTVLVPIEGRVRVAFDADNPGIWPLHCHNLLHMATGMMTEVEIA